MDATERRLRDAILAAPDDDIPRLLYADWAEARGDARGEFIRAQCALVGARATSQRMALRAKEKRLLRAHRKRWAKAADAMARKVVFSRGFISELWPAAKSFDALAGVLEDEPVTKLTLGLYRAKRAGLEAVLKMPGVERVRSLKVNGTVAELGEPGLKLVLESPLAAELRVLNFGTSGLSSKGLKRLAETTALPKLEVLSLSGNREVSDDVAARFVADAAPYALAGLHLSNTAVTGAFVDGLAGSSRAAGMKFLSLAGTSFDDAAAVRLAETPAFAGLRVIDLGRTKVTAKGASALAASPNLGGVIRLNLKDTRADRDEASRAALKQRFGSVVRLTRKASDDEEDEGDGDDEGDEGDGDE